MNIYKYELKANLRSTVLFIFGMIVFVGVYMSFFSSFANDAGNFLEILKGYPESLQKALGVAFSNITTLLGYYSFIMIFVVLIGSVQSMNLGLNILSKEERDKTAEFLLVKSVSRFKVMLSKLLAAVSLILLTNVLYNLGSFLLVRGIGNESFDLNTFFINKRNTYNNSKFLSFFGFFVGVFIKRIRTIIPISLAFVFGFYAIGAFAINADSDKLRYLSLFKYYDYNYILSNQALESSYLIFSGILIIILIIASFIIYQKRDIESI